MDSNEITMTIPQVVHLEDLKEGLNVSLSGERMKEFILGLDISQQDLNFSLTLVEDLLCSIKESVDEDEKHLVDDARSLLDEIGWR